MNQQRLLDLIDHPAQDPDAPHNPVLTAQVMERVRHEHATARVAQADQRPWLLVGVLVALGALATSATDMVGDGGLVEAAGLFDGDLVIELAIGAVIAAGALALSWRRLA